MFPNTFMMQELIRMHFDYMLDREDEGHEVDTPFVYTIAQESLPIMSTPFLDHLVILLPHSALISPPSWLRSAFHLYPGGQHADNRTANTLVLLPDGTYLELIAFLPHVAPEDRASHPWGREPDGHLVDYALSLAAGPDSTATPEARFAPIRERIAAGGSAPLRYPEPRTGGRTQKDGTEIRWATSFPEAAVPSVPFTRGELPFWCLDRTDRRLRVPYHGPENVRHPSGARGVGALAVSVSSQEALEVYARIQGVEGRSGGDGWTVWDLAAPEGPPSALRVRVRDGTATGGGKEKIKLTILTERGTEAKRIGGEIAEGVELWIDLEPET
ncbi:hypothetical protein ACHAPH_005469 [Verticillium nonalfalfae]